jgi:hypothetical protein
MRQAVASQLQRVWLHMTEFLVVYYKGEGGGFPQVRAMVSLVNLSCLWLILAPKVLRLCTNHLVLVLCRSVWVVETCQFFLVPSWSSSMPFYPSKVLRARERAPTLYSFVVSSLDSHLSPLKELRMHHVLWSSLMLFYGSYMSSTRLMWRRLLFLYTLSCFDLFTLLCVIWDNNINLESRVKVG